jgi:hypothetical protein
MDIDISPEPGLAGAALRPCVVKSKCARPRTCGCDCAVVRIGRRVEGGGQGGQQRALARSLIREVIGLEQDHVVIRAGRDERHARQGGTRGRHRGSAWGRPAARGQIFAREDQGLMTRSDFHKSAFRYTAPAESASAGSLSPANGGSLQPPSEKKVIRLIFT